MSWAILPLLQAAEHHHTLTGTHFPSHRGQKAELTWLAEIIKSTKPLPAIFSRKVLSLIIHAIVQEFIANIPKTTQT